MFGRSARVVRTFPGGYGVAALAYGKHAANGHASFAPREVALVLSKVDESTGEIITPPSSNVSRHIQTAVRYGFLARGSGARCLVVPAHAVAGGLGNAFKECAVHRQRKH